MDEKRTRYAQAAVEGELDELRRAPEGHRNNQLVSAARSLGTLVGAGVLDHDQVEGLLQQQGEAIGLGAVEARKTIKSGLNYGEARPRELDGEDHQVVEIIPEIEVARAEPVEELQPAPIPQEIPPTALAMRLTQWPHRSRANEGVERHVTWEELFGQVSDPEPKGDREKDDLPMWKLATFGKHPGTLQPYRSAQTFREAYALMLDYDSKEGEGNPTLTAQELEDCWGEFCFLAHTTPSHAPNQHRWRVILPLSRAVDADEYKKLAQWALRYSKQHGAPGLDADPTWDSPSRAFFIPVATDLYKPAANPEGVAVDVDLILWESEMLEREEAQEEAIKRLPPSMAESRTVEDLDREREAELIPIGTLPGWPGGPPTGHGWGQELNELLGGGVHPGYMAAVGAARAGAGKTAFVMQLATGLALRTLHQVEKNEPGPLTPVVVLSEMSIDALHWRMLARWTGEDSRWFRAGKSAVDQLDATEETLEAAYEKAKQAWKGELWRGMKFLWLYTPTTTANVVPGLKDYVSLLKEGLEALYGRPVCPVVVVDPIQRWQEPLKNEVEALNHLVESLHAATTDGRWITLLTSDTNKASATGSAPNENPQEKGAAAFRGSYKLMHLPDAAMVLSRPTEDIRGVLELVLVKNRWGSNHEQPRYFWDVKTGRFQPAARSQDGPLAFSKKAPAPKAPPDSFGKPREF